jgi:hypothetical protein
LVGVCADGDLFSPTPFTDLPPIDVEDILEQRKDEVLALQAIFGEDHVSAEPTGAVKVFVDLSVDNGLLAGIVCLCATMAVVPV